MKDFFKWRSHGIPLGKINSLMAAVTVIMSAVLLVTTVLTSASYEAMHDTTEQYIHWRTDAYDMQIASDYLTEQARCFVETGDREYLDKYFEEVHVTQRREKSLAQLNESLRDSSAYRELAEAMNQSVALMDREYYSMRLTVAAYGYDLSEFPEEIQAVRLEGSDSRLTPEGQSNLARNMVFNSAYREKKTAISEAMQRCLKELTSEMETQQTQSSERLHLMLTRQRALIIALIAITLAIVLMTSLLVISPLLRAVLHIRGDQLIPVRGSYEFRFLAQTYNLMFEVNRKSKEQLAFEASHDKLTGLYNRGGYDFMMDNVDLAECALLLVDVDRFKEINDTFGHEIGDRVLAWIASSIRGSFRSQDYVCRMGGDEFSVIMRPIGPQFTEMIREKINLINRKLKNAPEGLPSASISVGVAFGANCQTAKALYENADAALYQVKFHGRQGCAFHGEGAPAPRAD